MVHFASKYQQLQGDGDGDGPLPFGEKMLLKPLHFRIKTKFKSKIKVYGLGKYGKAKGE